MTVEHWTNDAGDAHSLIPADMVPSHKRLTLHKWPRKCCEIEGDSWEDCVRRFNVHMGWELVTPPSDAGPSHA